jgi:hypothetical protein
MENMGQSGIDQIYTVELRRSHEWWSEEKDM